MIALEGESEREGVGRVDGEDVRTEGEEKKEVQPSGGRECAGHASLPHPFVSL